MVVPKDQGALRYLNKFSVSQRVAGTGWKQKETACRA